MNRPILIDKASTRTSHAFGTTQIGKGGIVMNHQDGAIVAGNEVRFVGLPTYQSANSADRCGISLGDRFWPNVSPSLCSNTTVIGNLVHDISEPGAQSAVGILLGEAASSSGNVVANNMIYNVRSNGTSGHQAAGIGIGGSASGDVVAFNSILMTGDIDGPGPAATQSACGIRIAAGGTNLTLKNNAISVDVTSNTPGLKHFAIAAPSTSYSFGAGGMDHNDYFVNAGNAEMVLGGIGTSVPYVPVTTLPDWRNQFLPAQDMASVSTDPLFVSPTNLHIQSVPSPLVDGGVPVAGITLDFDGQLRGVTAPEIGADELAGISGAPAAAIPPVTLLSPGYPNPFLRQTTLNFTLEQDGYARLQVLDVQGRRVRTILDGTLSSGPHSVSWNGRDDAGARVASGCYIVTLEAGGRRRSRTLVVLN